MILWNGLGIDNASEDVDILLKELPQTVERLRKMSPLIGAEDLDQFRAQKARRR
jgi:hypothetical protein